MLFVLVAVFIAFAVTSVAQAVAWAVMVAYGIQIEEITIFRGKPLATFQWGNTRINLGWIPLGIHGRLGDEQYAALPARGRVTIQMLAPAMLIVIGLLLLGSEKGWHHFVTGFIQSVNGAVHPVAVGAVLVEKLHQVYQRSVTEASGVIAMKASSFALLPCGSSGLPILQGIFSPPSRPRRWVEGAAVIGALLMMLGLLIWAGIFCVYALKH